MLRGRRQEVGGRQKVKKMALKRNPFSCILEAIVPGIR